MTAKKLASKRTSTKASPSTSVNNAVLTAAEYERYVNGLVYPLGSIGELANLAIAGAWEADKAGKYAFSDSFTKLDKVAEKIADRFKQTHHTEWRDLPKDSKVAITKEDADDFEEALGPACSFINLVRHQDMNDNKVTEHLGWAGEFIVSIASEGLALMRDRLSIEGGAR